MVHAPNARDFELVTRDILADTIKCLLKLERKIDI